MVSKLENMYGNGIYDIPKNELEINLPYTFIQKSEVIFSWTELYWGRENRFISDETLIELAEWEVVNDAYSEEALELASIMKSEIFVEKKKIRDLIELMIDKNLLINKQYILNCKNKYLYAISSYIYQYPLQSDALKKMNKYYYDLSEDKKERDQGYEGVLSSIIEDFHAPSKPAQEFLMMLLELCAYGMRSMRAKQDLLESWHVFLEKQHLCFFNQWNKK